MPVELMLSTCSHPPLPDHSTDHLFLTLDLPNFLFGFVHCCFVVVVLLLLLVVVEGTGLWLWQLFPTDTPNGLYNLRCQPIARPVNSVVKRVLSHQGLSPIGPVFESHSWQMFFPARLITFELNCHRRSPRRVHIDSIETPWGASSQTPPILHVESM